MKRSKRTSDHALLLEGSKSYPKALAALAEFRQGVVDACRDAVLADLADIKKVFAIRLSEADLKDYRRPEVPEGADGLSATLGIKIMRDDHGWRQYYCVAWWEDKLCVEVVIWYADIRIANKICGALQRAQPGKQYQVAIEGKDVYLSRTLNPEQMVDLPQILRGLIKEWMRIWRSVGNTKALKPKAKTVSG